MNPNDLIESYVTEVAAKLPRGQRNDIAFELRELLNEELQAKAEAAGRGADAAMANELLQAFGLPADVAARYRPTLTIIDPADGRRFLWASVIGVAIIWAQGLVVFFQKPMASGWDLLQPLSVWWLGTAIPSLWWPGVLVVGFGLASWSRRRRPKTVEWKPRAAAPIQGGRVAKVMALLAILFGIFVLLDPRWVLDVFWGGRAAPAAYEALTYTETFRQRQAPFLLALLLVNVPIFLAVIVKGRWSPLLRRIETGLTLALGAVMAWTVLDGPVFRTPAADQTTKAVLVAIVAFVLLDLGIQLYRRVRPAPSRQARA